VSTNVYVCVSLCVCACVCVCVCVCTGAVFGFGRTCQQTFFSDPYNWFGLTLRRRCSWVSAFSCGDVRFWEVCKNPCLLRLHTCMLDFPLRFLLQRVVILFTCFYIFGFVCDFSMFWFWGGRLVHFPSFSQGVNLSVCVSVCGYLNALFCVMHLGRHIWRQF